MTSRDFAYWLQGLFELQNPTELTKEQTACIKRHLAMVFKHEIDPSLGDEKHQEELKKIHSIDMDEVNKRISDLTENFLSSQRITC